MNAQPHKCFSGIAKTETKNIPHYYFNATIFATLKFLESLAISSELLKPLLALILLDPVALFCRTGLEKEKGLWVPVISSKEYILTTVIDEFFFQDKLEPI